MKTPVPRQLAARKLGHIWQILYGTNTRAFYGYHVFRRQATEKAKAAYQKRAATQDHHET